ncbi:hypothetical protein CJD36_002815 [Flavipsychrobacter stenotrophus]|uniref:Uncharacterized protein n=1 Tax=Flavipsychrobacter stenotrophus TaxID=2077091 RepID=A0A2S7T0F8_9BACT|nr:hypothetical protein CJD36_002815 [Flavipsychrobacter stenotrophus]
MGDLTFLVCVVWVFGCVQLLYPTAYLLFFVPEGSGCTSCRPAISGINSERNKENGHPESFRDELLRTQKEPGCALLWLARPLFASSANASCSAAVVVNFELMPDGNENLNRAWG